MTLDLNALREKILAGGTYTPEELREAIAALRNVRSTQATQAVTKRKAAAPLSDEDLDASLASLGL